MRTYSAKLAALALTAATFALPAFAQDNSATPPAASSASEINKSTAAVTPDTGMMAGHRLSKVIGMDVVNDKDQTIGKIDDILLGAGNKATTAVISVGGFLGMGSKLVTVPFDELHPAANDRKSLTMQNASKEQLQSMPEFKYDRGA